MAFELSKEHEDFRRVVRDFAQAEVAPHAAGLQVITEPSRRYLSGSLLSHVLGYVGPISPEEYAALKDNDY